MNRKFNFNVISRLSSRSSGRRVRFVGMKPSERRDVTAMLERYEQGGLVKGLEHRRVGFERSMTEARMHEDSQEHVISGFGAVFGSIEEDYWGWEEQVAESAFDRSLEEDDIRSAFNHDLNWILARTASGSMTLEKRKDSGRHGIFYRSVLPLDESGVLTPHAKHVFGVTKRGDVDGSSFLFITLEETWNFSGDKPLRTITEVLCFEMGPVTIPYYELTTASAEQGRAYFDDSLLDEEGRVSEAGDGDPKDDTPPTPEDTPEPANRSGMDPEKVRAREEMLAKLPSKGEPNGS